MTGYQPESKFRLFGSDYNHYVIEMRFKDVAKGSSQRDIDLVPQSVKNTAGELHPQPKGSGSHSPQLIEQVQFYKIIIILLVAFSALMMVGLIYSTYINIHLERQNAIFSRAVNSSVRNLSTSIKGIKIEQEGTNAGLVATNRNLTAYGTVENRELNLIIRILGDNGNLNQQINNMSDVNSSSGFP